MRGGRLTVDREGYLPASRALRGVQGPIEVWLERGSEIVVQVLDAHGDVGIAGHIGLQLLSGTVPERYPGFATTDARGHGRIGPLPADSRWRLEVHAPGLVPVVLEEVAPGGATVTVRLGAGPSVEGVLVDRAQARRGAGQGRDSRAGRSA